MQIKVKKLTPTAKTPTRAYSKDSGLDLYIDHDLVLQPAQLIEDTSDILSEVTDDLGETHTTYKTYLVGESYLASTGICIELPDSRSWDSTYEATIRPKSGLSSKGLYIALGTIDNSYTGELKVVMINLSNTVMEFKQGQKIAQLVVQRVYLPEIVEVEELALRARADKGFGSSGLN